MRNKLFSNMTCVFVLLTSFSAAAWGQDAPYRIDDKQVKEIMHQLKNDTDKFRKSLDSSLDKSRLDGTKREDDINAFMKDYEKAVDQLYDRFNDHKSVSADVEAVIDGAVHIDRFMTRHSPGGEAERDWAAIRQDLRRLAEAYNVSWRWW